MNLIEAAASGRFIIATDVRGNADVVRQSGFGTLVKLNDDAAMAGEIREAYCGLPKLVSTESIRNYNEDSIVRTILDLYQESMQKGIERHV